MIRAVVALLLLAPGCFMSADPDLWRDAASVDGLPDATSGPEALIDAPTPDAGTDGPGRDLPPDAAPPDTVKPDAACGQMTINLSSAQDDGEIAGLSLLPDGESQEGSALMIGYWMGDSTWCYFRFALSQTIPAGASVTSAALQLWGQTSDTWDPQVMGLELRAESASDAPLVTHALDAPFVAATGRPVTAAVVRWPSAGGLSWSVGAYNTSSDLAPLLQELVNTKGALAGGNHVQLWIRGAQFLTGEVGTPNFKLTGYASHPARLTVTWCE